VRLWALRHRCWHLPRERRTPWRAAGREEGRAAGGGAARRRGAAGPVGGRDGRERGGAKKRQNGARAFARAFASGAPTRLRP
jgi:hypothetical protein